MIGILGLILLFSVIIVGGERGAISLIALCGNLLLLSLSIFLMAIGVPSLLVTIGASGAVSCITLFYQNGSNIKTWSAFVAVV